MEGFNLPALAGQFLQGLSLSTRGGLSLWAIRRDALSESVASVQALRSPDSKSVKASEPLGPGSFASRQGSTAVIPIYGPLMARMTGQYWSYEEIVRDIRLALADPIIDSIFYDIDSPGGTVQGIETAAAEMARAAGVKTSVAHTAGMCCSAAYWLASAAGEIVASKTSLVGSVGALIRYADLEGILTRLGASIVEVVATQSPNKRLDPNSDEGRAELQALTDHAGEMFLESLSATRNLDRATIMDRFGQGLVFHAEEALGRGMIERIGSSEETLAELAARPAVRRNAAAAAASAEKEVLMTAANIMAAQQPLTLEGLRASNPELVTAIGDEAANAERTRLAGIEANLIPGLGLEALIAAHKADATMTPANSAMALVATLKTMKLDALKGLAKLDKAAEGVVSRPSETGDFGGNAPAAAATPEGWKAEWAASETLKAEFATAEDYAGFKQAEASGKVKVLKRG